MLQSSCSVVEATYPPPGPRQQMLERVHPTPRTCCYCRSLQLSTPERAGRLDESGKQKWGWREEEVPSERQRQREAAAGSSVGGATAALHLGPITSESRCKQEQTDAMTWPCSRRLKCGGRSLARGHCCILEIVQQASGVVSAGQQRQPFRSPPLAPSGEGPARLKALSLCRKVA